MATSGEKQRMLHFGEFDDNKRMQPTTDDDTDLKRIVIGTEDRDATNAEASPRSNGMNAQGHSGDLTLPGDKTAHLFVSYSSEDRDTVHPIIADLEKNFGIICLFDDRDFHANREITQNIIQGMETSMKILLFMTENFIQSGWCKYETNAAFMLSMRTGSNNVIPVMLKECRVPNTLMTLTYINAVKEGPGLAAKIVDAYMNTDTEILPSHFGNTVDLVGKPENGDCVNINCTVEKSCWLRPAKKYIHVDDVTMVNISEGKYPLTEQRLETAVEIVNSYYSNSLLSKSDPFVLIGFVFCFLPLSIVLVFFAMGMNWVDSLQRSLNESTSFSASDWGTAAVVISIGITLVALLVVWVGSIAQRNWSFNRLTNVLFDKVTAEAHKDGVVFELLHISSTAANGYRRSIILRIIRYDTGPCLNYLETKVKAIQERTDGSELQEQRPAESVVQDLVIGQLRGYCRDFSSVNEAPVRRHRVRGGKACFCQVAEAHVSTYLQSGGKAKKPLVHV